MFHCLQLLKASDRLRTAPPKGVAKSKIGFMISDFTVCMTLAHGLELLQTYGLRAFSQYFTGMLYLKAHNNYKNLFKYLLVMDIWNLTLISCHSDISYLSRLNINQYPIYF